MQHSWDVFCKLSVKTVGEKIFFAVLLKNLNTWIMMRIKNGKK